MSRYRTVDPRMWDDDKFLDLSRDAQRLWFYLLTGPHVLALPGLSVAGVGSIADGLRDRPETVSKGLGELFAKGMAEADERRRVIRIPCAPKFNPPANANVIKGWFKLWRELPESPVKYTHLVALRAVIPADSAAQEAWRNGFGTVSEPLPEPSRKEGADPSLDSIQHSAFSNSTSTSTSKVLAPIAVATVAAAPAADLFASRPPVTAFGPPGDDLGAAGRTGTPALASLLAPPALATAPAVKAPRKSTAPTTGEKAEADAYMVAYRRHYPAAGVTVWGKAWHAWRAARKHRSLADLLLSLDTLATLRGEAATLGLGATLAEGWVSRGLLAARAPRVTPPARRVSGHGLDELYAGEIR